MAVYSRPGVFQPELDLSQVVRDSSSDVGVLVGIFEKGPINKRVLLTNTRDAISLFGKPSTTYGYALYCAICALETMNKLYMTRVVADDALSAALLVYNAAHPTGYAAVGGLTANGAQDIYVDTLYTVGTGNGSIVVFTTTVTNAPLADVTDIQVGGVTVGPLTVNKTLPVWTIAGPGLSGTASTVNSVTGVLSLTFAVAPANGASIKFFYQADDANRVFTVGAENPGVWGNNLKLTIDNVNNTTYTFDLSVFNVVDGVNVLAEKYTLSRKHQLDGFGRQQYLEDVVNGNSLYIRVYDNPLVADTVLPHVLTTQSLVGGVAGGAISSGKVIAGWDLYTNKQDVQIDILINAGFVSSADFTVQSKIKSICESRDDCFGILDAPYTELAMFPTTKLTTWRLTTQNFNSSYVALYSPWCNVYDSYNDQKNVPIPPSGFVAQVFSRRAQNTEAWFPPAGLNDGLVDSGNIPFLSLTHRYTEGQQDLIYSSGVNYLLTEPGVGTAVFGDKTQQTKASALDRINVRRLLNVLKRSMQGFLKFKLFELNTEFTRAEVTEALKDYMNSIQARQGVTAFLVVCDDTNNTSTVIDNNLLAVDIYIQPSRSINFIKNSFIITASGVNFDAVLNATLPS
jgi:Phage tail sheath C-terminal domain/Phage tail sheath protein subtilisin-like domain